MFRSITTYDMRTEELGVEVHDDWAGVVVMIDYDDQGKGPERQMTLNLSKEQAQELVEGLKLALGEGQA